MAMCGELKVKLGEMSVNGSVCYINLRERVFFTGTLRENIILDDPYNVLRYKQVLHAVALDPSLYPGGDMIEVLENGSNFTQIDRQKIVMARALYMNKDIYLIDDYFDKFDMNSMVEHFDSVVLGFLSSRLVFYVSNENVLAKRSDHVMVMNQGEVTEQGDYKSLFMNQDTLFRKIIMKHNARLGGGENIFGKLIEGREFGNKERNDRELKNIFGMVAQLFDHRYSQFNALKSFNPNSMKRGKHDFGRLLGIACLLYDRQDKGKIAPKENISIKNAPKMLIDNFMMARGKKYFYFLTILFSCSVILFIFSDIWIGVWSTDSLSVSTQLYFMLYTILMAVTASFLIFRDLFYSKTMIYNANTIYSRLVHKMILAK